MGVLISKSCKVKSISRCSSFRESSVSLKSSLSLKSSKSSKSSKSCVSLELTKPELPVILKPVDTIGIDEYQAIHYMFRALWGSNYSAPVTEILNNEGSRVLDICCGPGTWTLEMSDKFPGSYFTAIDIRRIFPAEIKPRNVNFKCENLLNKLEYPDNYFDYVYAGPMCFGITMNEWEKIILPEIIRVLKPGGFIEISVSDLVWYDEGPIAKQWLSNIVDKFKSINLEPVIYPQIIRILNQLDGFYQIGFKEKNNPMGSWGGDFGKVHMNITRLFFEGAKVKLEDVITHNDKKTYDKMIDDLFDEIEKSNMYNKCRRIWAMKKKM